MLIKKTIVLSDGVNAVGHLSIIRVGQETGAKLTLSKNFDGAYLMLKVGGKAQENFRVKGLKSEYKLIGNLEPNDLLGAVILGEGGVLASGGIRGMVSEKLPQKEEEKENPIIEIKEEKEEPKKENEEPEQEETEQMEGVETVAEKSEGEKENSEGQSEQVEEEREEKERVVEPIITPFKSVKGEHFYRNIRGKLNEIMTANPREKKLEELIPDSKWVRVYYDKGEYYVVGILTEDGEVTFLAYGVPGVKRVKPPKDAEELCDFVEVESSIGEGYWIMFQNAKNGEIVKSI